MSRFCHAEYLVAGSMIVVWFAMWNVALQAQEPECTMPPFQQILLRSVKPFRLAMPRIREFIHDTEASIFVEYLLLMTIVGIGTIAGLATVRGALLNELIELANSISAIVP